MGVPGKQPPYNTESKKVPGEVKKSLVEKITKLANGLIKNYTGWVRTSFLLSVFGAKQAS